MIKVSFNPKNRKFILRCPFHMNGVAKNFPSRRFDLRNKEWVLSACRKNVDELIRLKPSIDIDARALEEMGKGKTSDEVLPDVVTAVREIIRILKIVVGG